MIHYHGTPISGSHLDAVRFLRGRHALVSHLSVYQLGEVLECCQSFVLDSGAFTLWKHGGKLNVAGYTEWCESLSRHPGYDWSLIPDVIDGSESDNDAMLADWPNNVRGVPVFHLHESLRRAEELSFQYDIVALGSSGEFATPGTEKWWHRIAEVMGVMCDDEGRPHCRLHGLRMLDPAIFHRLPLTSADSTNAAQNGVPPRFGMYPPPSSGARCAVIADRIEAHNSAARWVPLDKQDTLFKLEAAQ
ncbi:MAG TPA: hypothetical protein VG713_10405 [Pirellulales bacterium]|nr:hypothetical protein [Pirellulales bacterium]